MILATITVMSKRVKANNADEGINELINANRNVFRENILNMLRSLRVTIIDKVKDPNNAYIVLYIEDEKYDVVVGDGKQRYVFNIPDSDFEFSAKTSHRNKSKIKASKVKVKLNLTTGAVMKKESGSVPKTIAASTVGAAGGYLACAALASNPATLSLALAAAGGAAVNTFLAAGKGSEMTQEPDYGTFEMEGSAEEIHMVLRDLKCANLLLKR